MSSSRMSPTPSSAKYGVTHSDHPYRGGILLRLLSSNPHIFRSTTPPQPFFIPWLCQPRSRHLLASHHLRGAIVGDADVVAPHVADTPLGEIQGYARPPPLRGGILLRLLSSNPHTFRSTTPPQPPHLRHATTPPQPLHLRHATTPPRHHCLFTSATTETMTRGGHFPHPGRGGRCA